jgi:hypothetical protein
MNRQDFEQLRDLPGKVISDDIEFASQQSSSPNLVFDGIAVKNSLNLDVVLNGTFKPEIPSVTFNFVVRGVGPICRLCVNSKIHKNAGRTHKHDLQHEDDPRQNLPNATARPELKDMTPSQVWGVLMSQASIKHEGSFKDPSGAK